MTAKIKILLSVVLVTLICGAGILAASAWYLIQTLSSPSAQYFMTLSEVMEKKEQWVGKTIRISGAVIGPSIHYDPGSKTLSFDIAEVPADLKQINQQGGLSVVLQNAVDEPDRPKITVHFQGEKPALLQTKAQAIITGKLDQEGIFIADEILLKCPSRYRNAVPNQAK